MNNKKNKQPISRTNQDQKKKKKSPERIFQQSLVVLLDSEIKGDVEWTHFPAGGGGPVRGSFLKKMGLKRGWPDLIFLREGQFYALELKVEAGKLSESQHQRHDRLVKSGAKVATAWNIEEAVAILDDWGLLKQRRVRKAA